MLTILTALTILTILSRSLRGRACHPWALLTIYSRSNDIYQVLQGPGVPPVDVLCGTLEICSYAASVVRDGRLAPATFR